MKEEIICEGLSATVKLLLLHSVCNTTFLGYDSEKFEVHVTSIASGHLRDLDTSAHKVAPEKYDDSHIVHYWGVIFFHASIACVVLKLGVNGIDTSISDIACRTFGSLLRSSSTPLQSLHYSSSPLSHPSPPLLLRRF